MLQIILHSGFLCLLKHIFGWFVVTTHYSLVLFCCQHVSYSVNRKFGSKFSMDLLHMGKDPLTVCIADDTEKFLLHHLQNACSLFTVLGSNHSASAAHSGLNLQRNLFLLEGVSAGPETDRFLSFDTILE